MGIKHLKPLTPKEIRKNTSYKKTIIWKKFWMLELKAFGLFIFLYFASANKFPENLFAIFLLPIMFSILLLSTSYAEYLERKRKKEL